MSKRKYYRICPVCGEKHEQSEMVRTDASYTGWMCADCFEDWCNEHLEYEIDEW